MLIARENDLLMNPPFTDESILQRSLLDPTGSGIEDRNITTDSVTVNERKNNGTSLNLEFGYLWIN